MINMSITTTILRKARLACLKIFIECLSFMIYTTLSLLLLFERFAITTSIYASNLLLLSHAWTSLWELWNCHVRIRYRSDCTIKSMMKCWSCRIYIITDCTQSRLERRQRKRRSKRIIQWAIIKMTMRVTMNILRCKTHLHRRRFYRFRSLLSSESRIVHQNHRIDCEQKWHRHNRQSHSDDVNRRLKTSLNVSSSTLNWSRSFPLVRCLTVNRRVSEEIHNEASEKVDNEAGEGIGSEVGEKMQRIKLAMFRPSTWAVFRCNLDKGRFWACKRYVSGLNLQWENGEKIHWIWW